MTARLIAPIRYASQRRLDCPRAFKLPVLGHLLGRLMAICSLSALLAACVTQPTTPEQASGSLRVADDGRPLTTTHYRWSKGSWDDVMASLRSSFDKEPSIELNPVHDGSLRILLPADKVFSGNHVRLRRQIHPVLNALAEQMQQRQSLRLRIVGHADTSGDDTYNQILSINRANAVATYLIKQGLRSSRIELEGRGSIDPLVSNDSRENRRINRRIEIYIYRIE